MLFCLATKTADHVTAFQNFCQTHVQGGKGQEKPPKVYLCGFQWFLANVAKVSEWVTNQGDDEEAVKSQDEQIETPSSMPFQLEKRFEDRMSQETLLKVLLFNHGSCINCFPNKYSISSYEFYISN